MPRGSRRSTMGIGRQQVGNQYGGPLPSRSMSCVGPLLPEMCGRRQCPTAPVRFLASNPIHDARALQSSTSAPSYPSTRRSMCCVVREKEFAHLCNHVSIERTVQVSPAVTVCGVCCWKGLGCSVMNNRGRTMTKSPTAANSNKHGASHGERLASSNKFFKMGIQRIVEVSSLSRSGRPFKE